MFWTEIELVNVAWFVSDNIHIPGDLCLHHDGGG